MNTYPKFRLIKPSDSDFPERLKVIPNPPKQLYIAGNITPADNLALAVVGTRKMTSYGKDCCLNIVPGVSLAGVTIVSGLMYGIDLTAQRTAVDCGGRTIGVLGFGSNYLYKVRDSVVLNKILKEGLGAIISEFEPNESPARWTFPKRNRLIAGLSRSILVIEADIKSGTYHTVDAALQQGKDILSVPGPICNPSSRGTNRLIKDGAEVVTEANDVLYNLGLDSGSFINNANILKPNTPLTLDEISILKVLDFVDTHVDDIIHTSGLKAGVVISGLVSLELKEMVKDVGGGMYKRS